MLLAGYAAFARRDLDAILEIAHPEIEAHDPPEMPDSAIHYGREAVKRDWEQTLELFDEFTIDVERVFDAGDEVVLFLHYQGRGRESGAEVELRLAHVVTFRDGKATRFRQFLDRDMALEVAGLSESNVEIVQAQIEAFNRGDFSAAIDALDEDVEWQVPDVAALDAPVSGLLRGKREMIENFRQWFEAWDSYRFEVTEIRAGRGGGVFVAGVQTGRGRGSGLDVTLPTFHVVTVREGKVARMRSFAKREDALEAAGLAERDPQM